MIETTLAIILAVLILCNLGAVIRFIISAASILILLAVAATFILIASA